MAQPTAQRAHQSRRRVHKLSWLLVGVVALSALSVVGSAAAADGCADVMEGSHRLLASSEEVDVCEAYGDRLVLVVNTASQCGFVGQFEGLEALYQRYRDQGFTVLGFPSNDFNQEHADEDKTAEVCQLNYGVSFPMMATTTVKGASANRLFSNLAAATQAPGWNFNKYLIDPNNHTVEHFGASIAPTGGALEERIAQLLGTSSP